jgi:hypothetical protein
MRTIIEDTTFPAGTHIRISGGIDELLFLRCSFEGGEILVEHEVDRIIFSQCFFRGTNFSEQSLSERIATACRRVPPETEEMAPPSSEREGKFRS